MNMEVFYIILNKPNKMVHKPVDRQENAITF